MNILVLTSVFYIPGKSREYNTKIVNFFVKEWVQQGHRVFVVYNKSIFPKIYYSFPRFFYDLIESRFAVVIDPEDATPDELNLVHDAVVVTLPMVKLFPHANYSKKAISRQIEKIQSHLADQGFVPEVILGHWERPQIELIPKLKAIYACKTSLVFHSPIRMMSTRHRMLISDFDAVGFRNPALMKNALGILNSVPKPFVCYSGIPEEMLRDRRPLERNFSGQVATYAFVGGLIKRKYPSVLLEAILRCKRNFTLHVVGQGSEKGKIIELARKEAVAEQVVFHGRIPRHQIFELLGKVECFCMISKDEAFGLVYLEAMAAGCLVIASKGEGMDGIIQDGVNGFLCEAGNLGELVKKITWIDSLSPSQKKDISNKAVQTAREYTDAAVAKKYLEVFD